MRATVTDDCTTRVIRLNVSDVPDIDVTTYHRKPRIFRPDQASITLVDGEVTQVSVRGGLVLKSGGTSDAVQESSRWYGERELSRLPGWLKVMVDEAPAGVTTWGAGEVQAL